jgi:hypothetical protein
MSVGTCAEAMPAVRIRSEAGSTVEIEWRLRVIVLNLKWTIGLGANRLSANAALWAETRETGDGLPFP